MEVGKEYDGMVRAIVHGNNRGVHCNIGEKGAKALNMDGFIPKLSFNAKTGCAFKRNDRVSVVCVKTHPRVEFCPTSEYVRPLLILDINGPLGTRSTFTPQDKEGKRRSFKERPHLKDFLALVAQHFEVAVWSCGRGDNLELSLFSGIDLLFVWCQNESTNLWPRKSCVTSDKVHIHSQCATTYNIFFIFYVTAMILALIYFFVMQPLFLKEISKVWKQFPAFNASNTLLIDNHLEKFEVCNLI